MAYRPVLVQKFQAIGAEWTFRHPDKAMVAVVSSATPEFLATLDVSEIPQDLAEALLRVYDDGIVGWSGVEDASGNVLQFSRENALAIPTLDKIMVAVGYLVASVEGNAEMGQSAGQPTGITPPNATAGRSDTSTP